MASTPGNVTPYRRIPRPRDEWAPRLSAVEIVGTEPGLWRLRLTDRATHLELALVRLAYGAELMGEDSRGMILKPRPDLPLPTRAELEATLAEVHARSRPRVRK